MTPVNIILLFMLVWIFALANECAAALDPEFEDKIVEDFLYYAEGGAADRENAGRSNRAGYPSATLANLQVVRSWDELSAAARARLEGYIRLGPWEDGRRVVYSYNNNGCLEAVNEDDDSYMDSEHFRVVYTPTGPHAADQQYITDLLDASEYIWDIQINSYGLPPPPPPLEGDGLYRVYVCDLLGEINTLGYTIPTTVHEDDYSWSYISLDNDYDGVDFNNGITLSEYVAVVQAHEFFHAIQFGISYYKPSFWVMEMSAVWMEEYIYPDANDYVSAYLPEFYSYLYLPLDSEASLLEYGSAIFMHHITQHVADDSFVRLFWTTFKQECIDDPSLAWCHYTVSEVPFIDEMLQQYGTDIHDTFRDFNVNNYTKNYEDGGLDYFPDVITTGVTQTTTVNNRLDYLAARFYKVTETDTAYKYAYSIGFEAGGAGDEWRISLVTESHEGEFGIQHIPVIDGSAALADIPIGPQSENDALVLIVNNASTSGLYRDYELNFTRQVQDADTLSHDFSAGWHLVGTPFTPVLTTAWESFGLDAATRIVGFADGAYSDSASIINPPGENAAYWLYFEKTSTAVFQGIDTYNNIISLNEGWNLVSFGSSSAVTWDETITVAVGGQEYPLGAAGSLDCLDPVFYRYATDTQPPGFVQVGIPDAYAIPPWEGFAVKAETDCSLVLQQRD